MKKQLISAPEGVDIDWASPKFSQAWRVGPFVFVAGQVAADEHGNALGADIEAQTRIAYEALTRILRHAGGDMSDVVQLRTFYVHDGPEEEADACFDRMTRVREEFLADPGPASIAVRVAGLARKDLLIEVEAIAMIEDPDDGGR